MHIPLLSLHRIALCIVALLLLSAPKTLAQEIYLATYETTGSYQKNPDFFSPSEPKPYSMVTEIHPNRSIYYNPTQMVSDSVRKALEAANVSHNEILITMRDYKVKGLKMAVINDFNAQRRDCYLHLLGDLFYYNEEMQRPQWQVDESVTEEHAGYPCHRATTSYLGREWTVWYTPEIPTPAGPWKLWGLPGLIVKADESEGLYTFSLTSFTSAPNSQSKMNYTELAHYEKMEKQKKQKIFDFLAESVKDPIGFLNRSLGATVTVNEVNGRPVTNDDFKNEFINIEQ